MTTLNKNEILRAVFEKAFIYWGMFILFSYGVMFWHILNFGWGLVLRPRAKSNGVV